VPVALDAHPDLARLEGARPSRVADAVSAVGEPGHLVILTLVVVSVTSTASLLSALGWVVLTTVFCVVLPSIALRILIARGLVLDRHVVVREQRTVPLLVALASVATGLGLLVLLSAPRPVVALVAAMLAGAIPMSVVSRWYKASFHVGVAGGTAVILVLVLGPWWVAVVTPLLLVVGWARVRAGRHTVGQVLVGAGLGCAAAAVVFPWLA
jgi:membrane-associated phospholipid phosphatase